MSTPTKNFNLYNLANTNDIARILNVRPSAVSNWKQRHEDFPKPVWRDFYDIREVDKWWRNRNV